MSAETAVPMGIGMDVRRMAVCAAIATSALLLMAECGNDNNSGGGGGRSPIDTSGVPGSGYQPPQRFHTPKGMGELPPTESVAEQKQIARPLGHTAADLPDFGTLDLYAPLTVYEV